MISRTLKPPDFLNDRAELVLEANGLSRAPMLGQG